MANYRNVLDKYRYELCRENSNIEPFVILSKEKYDEKLLEDRNTKIRVEVHPESLYITLPDELIQLRYYFSKWGKPPVVTWEKVKYNEEEDNYFTEDNSLISTHKVKDEVDEEKLKKLYSPWRE